MQPFSAITQSWKCSSVHGGTLKYRSGMSAFAASMSGTHGSLKSTPYSALYSRHFFATVRSMKISCHDGSQSTPCRLLYVSLIP